MSGKQMSPMLVDRETLCRLLGNISVSHVIRLERIGSLARARVQVGKRAIRYDLSIVKEMVAGRNLL